ncbi:winged helix-turn-helix transcriptional regulator [bacterium]|nr:winged helix-turn-helix transcriptional regulator [bacterium]
MHFDDHLIGFLKASNYRQKILQMLTKSNFTTPSDLAKELNITLPQVSRTLSELERAELVMCTTPNRSKGRIYRITTKGSNVFLNMREK